MLPTFCPPTIWTISLEFYRKPSILAADDFLGACYRKAMTPQKLWTLLFLQVRIRTGPTITSQKRVKDEKVYKPHFLVNSGGFSLEKAFRNPCGLALKAEIPPRRDQAFY